MSGAVASAQPTNAVLGGLGSSLGVGTPPHRTPLARSQSAAHAGLLRTGQQPQGSLPAVWAPELARANSLQATFAGAQASLLQAQAQAQELAGMPLRVGGSKRDFASISTLGTNDSVTSHQTVVRKAASPSQVSSMHRGRCCARRAQRSSILCTMVDLACLGCLEVHRSRHGSRPSLVGKVLATASVVAAYTC